ncbi:hypothetical protein C2E23DRAFT_340909 [Lenzites betulinus]|nr:hypothetical protein C2E23DRAFT_340909 [Lenzites betulinus]
MSAIANLIDLNSTFGALFIGFGASSLAFGILTMQAYSYFRRYPSDVWWYRSIVAAMWVLELVDQALIGHAVYFYVVTNWGSVIALLEGAVWTLIIQVTLGAVAGAMVKTCFGLRVWRFSQHNVPVTMLIMLGTLAQLVAAFVFTVKAFQVSTLTRISELKLVGSIAIGLGMATDVITAAALCHFLRGLKTGYGRDDSIINKLTLYAINTGVITSAISLSTLILFNLMPSNFIFMAFYFVLSKVYANSFFAALNTRRSVRGRGTEGDHTTVPTFLMVDKTTKHEVHNDPVYSIVRATTSAGGGTRLDLPAHSSSSAADNTSDDFLDMAAGGGDRGVHPYAYDHGAGGARERDSAVDFGDDSTDDVKQQTRSFGNGIGEYSQQIEVPREPPMVAMSRASHYTQAW